MFEASIIIHQDEWLYSLTCQSSLDVLQTCVQMHTCTQSHIQGSQVVKFHFAFREQCFVLICTFVLLHFLSGFFITTSDAAY